MSSSEENHIELEINHADADSKEYTSIPVNKLKKGGYVMIQNRPCRAVDIAVSKPGKHGHAKASIIGADIFTGRRYNICLPTSHEIEVPFVDRQDYELINIEDNHTQLLTRDGNLREDVDIPEEGNEIRDRILKLFNKANNTGAQVIVTVITSMGESLIADCK